MRTLRKEEGIPFPLLSTSSNAIVERGALHH